MKKQNNSASVNDNEVIITILQLTLKPAKGALHQLNETLIKNVAGDERELMHIISALKRMRRITATLGDQEERVSAFKYLNHAPVTPFPHVDVSVYQNEG